MHESPLFIVVEGIDGAGTTTQGDRLCEALIRSGRKVHRTREPSDGEIGQLLRRALRHQTANRMSARQVALLFAADRLDHCQNEIGVALSRGEFVVCDRYLGSSLTFQVIDGEGDFDAEWVRSLNQPIMVPDLSLLIDVPVEVSLARIISRGKPIERFEVSETLTRVRDRYLHVFESENEGLGAVHVVDGTPDADTVAFDVLGRVMAIIDKRASERSVTEP
ncbi:MAG: dTMP kinase [Myxococcales bacterium]|nr:dTMP kinase [Myxococcales bacterium]